MAALTDSHKLVFTEDSPSLRSVSEILLFTTAKMVCGEGQLFACRLIYASHKKHKQTNLKKKKDAVVIINFKVTASLGYGIVYIGVL